MEYDNALQHFLNDTLLNQEVTSKPELMNQWMDFLILDNHNVQEFHLKNLHRMSHYELQ